MFLVDVIQLINAPPEEESKRNYRKTGAPLHFDSKKRSPSPPVVLKPIKKKIASSKKTRSQSLSSVSTISSSDLSDFEPDVKKKVVDVKARNRNFRYRSRSR